ncbi:HIT-like domain-containing protein [Vararia minispora EC-137]|uniref:HIT-like domain-containing protein n=1 Tax=Vararia minispora EC-137 TaxID=1314806 RepID=A0ACB8QQ35_9AGAM|nr:HIT-like domain-containing protein [Vararia minispora EC-137]
MGAATDDKCVFCAIVQGIIPSHKVYETEQMLAFLDINPVSEGHTQVIPKYHAKTLVDLPDEYLAEVGLTLKKVALATGAEQFNVLQNNGKLAFQHVDHVHFHVVPKPSEKEGLVLTIDENWPARKADSKELEQTVARMKARLA